MFVQIKFKMKLGKWRSSPINGHESSEIKRVVGNHLLMRNITKHNKRKTEQNPPSKQQQQLHVYLYNRWGLRSVIKIYGNTANSESEEERKMLKKTNFDQSKKNFFCLLPRKKKQTEGKRQMLRTSSTA